MKHIDNRLLMLTLPVPPQEEKRKARRKQLYLPTC